MYIVSHDWPLIAYMMLYTLECMQAAIKIYMYIDTEAKNVFLKRNKVI